MSINRMKARLLVLIRHVDVAGDSIGNTLSQTFNTTAGTVYVLDFDAGIFGEPSGNPLQLRVQVTGPGTLLDQTVNPPVTGLGLADCQHYTFTFTAGASTTTLQFSDRAAVTVQQTWSLIR